VRCFGLECLAPAEKIALATVYGNFLVDEVGKKESLWLEKAEKGKR
jgi:hypothetical protein